MSQVQQVPNATIQDAETALFQECGKQESRELFRDASQVQWAVRLARRISAKCTIIKSGNGVSIQLESYFGKAQMIVLVVCYCLCILPGIVCTIQLLIIRAFASRKLPEMLAHIATTTKHLASSRQASPPPGL